MQQWCHVCVRLGDVYLTFATQTRLLPMMRQMRVGKIGLAAIMACALISCGVSDEVAAVCSRASDFESSMVAVDQSIQDLSIVAPRQLQSSFAVFLGSLVTINEIAQQLGFSHSTVRQESIAIYKALQIEGRTAIADRARQLQLF
jgi:hypothetical protein